MDRDGLIHAGAPGTQLTWMDAKVGDWVVTPRMGKPVEIQALWINALRIAAAWNPGSPEGQRWSAVAAQATAAFLGRFPDRSSGGLLDLVDGDPVEGRHIRPNQIFACGGLPHTVAEPALARQIVDLVEARLLTPLGLRTLDPADPAYRPRFEGGPLSRDGAYHQGTAWPWLLGPFVEAWLRLQPDPDTAKAQARGRFLPPLRMHLAEAGLGHVSEVVDGDAPHHPGGCPFQAWSLGALMQIEALLHP
jgi:predicted glycogen debranching enzyme